MQAIDVSNDGLNALAGTVRFVRRRTCDALASNTRATVSPRCVVQCQFLSRCCNAGFLACVAFPGQGYNTPCRGVRGGGGGGGGGGDVQALWAASFECDMVQRRVNGMIPGVGGRACSGECDGQWLPLWFFLVPRPCTFLCVLPAMCEGYISKQSQCVSRGEGGRVSRLICSQH